MKRVRQRRTLRRMRRVLRFHGLERQDGVVYSWQELWKNPMRRVVLTALDDGKVEAEVVIEPTGRIELVYDNVDQLEGAVAC